MSKRHRLHQLLQEPRIWKAGQGAGPHQTVSTGFPDLDRALSGGWPTGVLTELLVDLCGIGELQLLLPALKAFHGRPIGSKVNPPLGAKKWIIWVAPPYMPYAPALVRAGVDISRLIVAHCDRQNDVLWAMEQALRSGACAAALAWSEGSDPRALRRLQLAVEKGLCWGVLLRPARFKKQRSPAALRIHLLAVSLSEISMDIFKNYKSRPQKIVVGIDGKLQSPARPFGEWAGKQKSRFDADF
ncbi:MAG: translesion DNA synthesis-associated protein ImuA [Gammaproteobacteria bacterium]|nr:translesion DNA synthesis-associated protein ImuA [Gammaproteobacteria bacterium]